MIIDILGNADSEMSRTAMDISCLSSIFDQLRSVLEKENGLYSTELINDTMRILEASQNIFWDVNQMGQIKDGKNPKKLAR